MIILQVLDKFFELVFLKLSRSRRRQEMICAKIRLTTGLNRYGTRLKSKQVILSVWDPELIWSPAETLFFKKANIVSESSTSSMIARISAMESPTSPSPQPKISHPSLPQPFVTTDLDDTLPRFSRPSSASAIYRKPSNTRKKNTLRAIRLRRSLSADPSRSSATSGSDFSIAQYTIDLQKLGEKESELTMNELEDKIDSINSEFDGPKDFTLNMEKWMRGSEKWRKAGGHEDNQSDDGDDEKGDNSEEEIGDENSQPAEESGEESEFVPLSTSTPAVFGKQMKVGEDRLKIPEKQIHQPPPLSRLNTETMQNRAAEEVFDQISALQAEVEKLRIENENSRLSKDALNQQYGHLQAENDEIKAELRNVRNDALNLQQEIKLSEKALALERKSREDAGTRVSSLRAKFDPVVQELAITRSTAESEKLAVDTRIATLDAKLQKLQTDNAEQQMDAQKTQNANVVKFQDLRSELDICKGEIKAFQQALNSRFNLREEDRAVARTAPKQTTASHGSESNTGVLKIKLSHANEQLTESRRVVETVEDENDRLTQENERLRMENTKLALEVEKKNAVAEAAESRVKDLSEEIDHIQAEKNAGSIEEGVREAEIDDLRQQHEANLFEVKSHHEKQLKVLKSALHRVGDGMRKRENRLQDSYQEQIATLKEEITTLQARPNPPADPSSPSTFDFRNTIR